MITGIMYQRVVGALDTQKDRILRNEYIELVESMRRQLEDPQICPTLIGDQPISGTDFSAINASFGTINPAVITPGWQVRPGGVQISAIKLLNPTLVKTMYMANDGATYQLYRGNLMLNPSNVLINLTGPQGRSDLLIPLLFMTQGGRIKGCFGETSQAGQCVAIGNAYDWRAASGGYSYPQYRCHPQKSCRYTSTGTFTASSESAANAKCTFPYSATSVGTFMDSGEGRWFCQWCNSYYHD